MNRELKIRIWDIEAESYLPGITDIYEAMFNDGCYYQHTSEISEVKKRYIIEQFTGVQDKRNVDVYEGDITDEGAVEWIKGLHWDGGGSMHPGFYYNNKYDEGDMSYHKVLDCTCTITGNVHKTLKVK